MASYSVREKQTPPESSFSIGGAILPMPPFNPMDMRTSAVNEPNLIQLIQKGYSLKQLIEAGFSAWELRKAGFTASELKEEGYALEQLKDAEYTVAELLPCFTIDDLITAGFTKDKIYVIFEIISKHKQDLQDEFSKRYCFVRCIDRPEEEKLLLFEDEMDAILDMDSEYAKLLKKQYTFRCASFIAQGLPFPLYHHDLFALYSSESVLARLAGKSEIPVWGKSNLGSDVVLEKNGADPLRLIDHKQEYRLAKSSIEDYIADLHKRKLENIAMPETLGNFKVENLLGIGIYIDGPDWCGRIGMHDEFRNKLANVKDFYEFLMSKGFYVPLTIYRVTEEHPGELEIFSDWKSFEAATLAAIGRLEDEHD